jgi:hypothetical protein
VWGYLLINKGEEDGATLPNCLTSSEIGSICSRNFQGLDMMPVEPHKVASKTDYKLSDW